MLHRSCSTFRALAVVVLILGLSIAPTGPAAASPDTPHQTAPIYSPNGPTGTVYRLYRAYFLREPDRSGYDYWLGRYKAGMPLTLISDEFSKSAEFRATYGDLDNEQFLNTVYKNVLGRTPDKAGKDYWLDQMARGMPRGTVMINFSDSAEFRSKTADGTPPGYRRCSSERIYGTADGSCLADLEDGSGDVDCGEIPRAARPVTIYNPANDPYRLDSDNDGQACEVN